MTTPTSAPDRGPRIGDRALGRGVTATWWYTATALVFFQIITPLSWVAWIPLRYDDTAGRVELGLWLGLAATILAVAGLAVLLREYRPSVMAQRHEERRGVRVGELVGIGMMLVAACLLGVATGSWLAGVGVVAGALSARAWPRGIRWRVVIGLTVVLIALWVVEAPALSTRSDLYVPALFTTLLPATFASSMWWWVIVLELDRAREAESALAATRERLRLANDVHDLQGHHLQVIALQLELAERLLTRDDPDGAAREIARAREAVDDARQGTRDLASQFRGVPLPDELENAADLLRSAGLQVTTDVDADVGRIDALGPIVRESVTNVLKHGGGRHASLSLARNAERWVYRIANDDPGDDDTGWGSGLYGMTARAEAVGGEVRVSREGTTFALTVTLPADAASVDQEQLA
ncbi:sensor histidine kinase [Microbacterium sp. A1-JK]|uniref:sensor histidine kinase n=1 Tax=Microbacterium sp. A1-JK TaxID=3177516 RepID=UPI0038862974